MMFLSSILLIVILNRVLATVAGQPNLSSIGQMLVLSQEVTTHTCRERPGEPAHARKVVTQSFSTLRKALAGHQLLTKTCKALKIPRRLLETVQLVSQLQHMLDSFNMKVVFMMVLATLGLITLLTLSVTESMLLPAKSTCSLETHGQLLGARKATAASLWVTNPRVVPAVFLWQTIFQSLREI